MQMSNPSHHSFLYKLTLIAVQRYGNICVARLNCPAGVATDPAQNRTSAGVFFVNKIMLSLLDFKLNISIGNRYTKV